MTKEDFYKDLSDDITAGCSLPFNIPEKALDVIVKYTKEWFYRNWDDAVESTYLLIPRESWENDNNFKSNKGIILPSCVYSVHSVSKDQGSIKRNAIVNSSLVNMNNFSDATWGLNGGNSVEDGMHSDAVLGFVIASSWNDLSYHLFNYPISYSFNRNTSRLFLKGSVSERPDFILECDIRIPDAALYREDLFYQFCKGRALNTLSNILGTFEMELPGSSKINYDRFADQGDKLIEEVKEEVKNSSSGSAFILTSGNGI